METFQMVAPVFDERARVEVLAKGYVEVQVLTPDSNVYTLYVYDLVQLQQDASDAFAAGSGCFADPGMVIVPEVREAVIESALGALWRQGFFDTLRPVSPG